MAQFGNPNLATGPAGRETYIAPAITLKGTFLVRRQSRLGGGEVLEVFGKILNEFGLRTLLALGLEGTAKTVKVGNEIFSYEDVTPSERDAVMKELNAKPDFSRRIG